MMIGEKIGLILLFLVSWLTFTKATKSHWHELKQA